jgi:hypothetical protein
MISLIFQWMNPFDLIDNCWLVNHEWQHISQLPSSCCHLDLTKDESLSPACDGRTLDIIKRIIKRAPLIVNRIKRISVAQSLVIESSWNQLMTMTTSLTSLCYYHERDDVNFLSSSHLETSVVPCIPQLKFLSVSSTSYNMEFEDHLWIMLSSLQTLELRYITLSKTVLSLASAISTPLSCYRSLTRLVLDDVNYTDSTDVQPDTFSNLESLSCWQIQYNVMSAFVLASPSSLQRISSRFLPIPLQCIRRKRILFEHEDDEPLYNYIYHPSIKHIMPQLHTIAYYMSAWMGDDMFLNNQLSLPTDFHLSSIWPRLTRFYIEVSADELSSSLPQQLDHLCTVILQQLPLLHTLIIDIPLDVSMIQIGEFLYRHAHDAATCGDESKGESVIDDAMGPIPPPNNFLLPFVYHGYMTKLDDTPLRPSSFIAAIVPSHRYRGTTCIAHSIDLSPSCPSLLSSTTSSSPSSSSSSSPKSEVPQYMSNGDFQIRSSSFYPLLTTNTNLMIIIRYHMDNNQNKSDPCLDANEVFNENELNSIINDRCPFRYCYGHHYTGNGESNRRHDDNYCTCNKRDDDRTVDG